MKNFFVLPLLMLAFHGFAQQQCGTSFSDQEATTDRLKANIEYFNKFGIPENAITYIPVFFHLTANTAGDGRAGVKDIFNILCTLNADYAEHNIQFYMVPHATYGLVDFSINNDNVYNNQTNSFLMKLRKHANAVNYYIVGEAQTNNQQPGGAAAYYTPANDWIVVNKGYSSLGESTSSHETGHFFSLRHTFYGWESDAQDWQNEPPCFESADPGWPCAPAISPGGTPTEKADGSNCSVAADLICDTPPDYNFGYCENPSVCGQYNGGAQDPMCQPVDPMENNFMSYYFNCTDYDFTPLQEGAIKADILSSQRNFLDNNYTPPALTIATPADLLVSPAQDEVVSDDDTAVLTWNAVAGATYYYVEVDITTTFSSPQLQYFLVAANSTLTVTGLTANKKYNWRVRPFNEYYVCAAAKTRSFKTNTISSVEHIEDVAAWAVVPNPAGNEQDISVTFSTAQQVDNLSLNIYDLAGKLIFVQNEITLFPGQSAVNIPAGRFSEGVFFVTLIQSGKKETKRLVVSRN
jgi:hypothetical protein